MTDTHGRLRDIRKRQGLSQEQLAERLGKTKAAVSRWERGLRKPDVGYDVWAEALDCRIETVVIEPGTPTLQDLDDQGREVIRKLMAALPNMSDRQRDSLEAALGMWIDGA